MAGFYSILSKGIDALDPNTPEARRKLYERATAALMTEMRGPAPALSQAEFQAAWRSLKEAIVRIETEIEAKVEAQPESHNSPLIPAPDRGRGQAPAGIQPLPKPETLTYPESWVPAGTSGLRESKEAEEETEAEATAQAEAAARADAQPRRPIPRPTATPSTFRPHAGPAAPPPAPPLRLGGQPRPRFMGLLTRAFRRDPDRADRNGRRRPAAHGEEPSDVWTDMVSDHARDTWLSDILTRASRDDHATLKKRT